MATATQRIDEKSSSDENAPGYFGISTSHRASNRHPTAGLPTPAYSNLDLYKSMTGPENVLYTPLTPGTASGASSRRPSSERRQDEREEREMFSKLEKPRVRYDVEVVTKLIVYTGMFFIISNADLSNRYGRYCLDRCRRCSHSVRDNRPRTWDSTWLKE